MSDKNSGALIGVGVWVFILVMVAYNVWWPERADLLLQLQTHRQSEQSIDYAVSVVARHEGQAVDNGVVQLRADDAARNQYWRSIRLDSVGDGEFGGVLAGVPVVDGKPLPLRLTATYVGVEMREEEGETSTGAEVTGRTTLSLGTYLPLSPSLVWGGSALGGILTIALIAVFTGALTRRKMRALFIMLYLVTFLAMVVPLVAVVWIPNSEALLALMERAPLGLVRGTIVTDGDDADKEPQWLVHIGSVVTQVGQHDGPVTVAAAAAGTPGGATGEPGGDGAAAGAAEGPAPSLPRLVRVEGGLAVPFYVIMLALLGAAINMTRRLPEIQRDSVEDAGTSPGESPVLAFLRLSAAPFVGGDQPAEVRYPAWIRSEAIKNFMYLLSAPFLAIAMYYLLRMAATDVEVPVLVVMAFATGLRSDSIIRSILSVAGERLPAPPDVAGTTASKPKPEPEAETATETGDAEAPETEGAEPEGAGDAAAGEETAPDGATTSGVSAESRGDGAGAAEADAGTAPQTPAPAGPDAAKAAQEPEPRGG